MMSKYVSFNNRGTYDFDNISVFSMNNAALQSLDTGAGGWLIAAGVFFFPAALFLGPLTALFVGGFAFGFIKRLRNKRLKDMAIKYYELLKTRESWSAREIAFYLNLSVTQVRLDLQALFDKKVLILSEPKTPSSIAFGCPSSDYIDGFYSYDPEKKELKTYVKPEENLSEQETKKEEKKDELYGEAEEFLRQIRQADEEIDDEVVSERIKKIEQVTYDICKAAGENPEMVKKTRRFMQYYLPTTVKLLNTYVRMDKAGVQTDNIKKIKNDIAQSLETIVQAFYRLYDSLYDFDAIDITSEIEAFKGALATDGLIEEGIGLELYEDKMK